MMGYRHHVPIPFWELAHVYTISLGQQNDMHGEEWDSGPKQPVLGSVPPFWLGLFLDHQPWLVPPCWSLLSTQSRSQWVHPEVDLYAVFSLDSRQLWWPWQRSSAGAFKPFWTGQHPSVDGNLKYCLSRESQIEVLPWTCQGIRLQCRRPEFDPWIGKIIWRRVRQPPPVFLPGESHGQRNLSSYSPQDRRVGHKCSDWALTLLPYFPHIMRSILPPTAWDCPDQSTWASPGPFLMWLSL